MKLIELAYNQITSPCFRKLLTTRDRRPTQIKWFNSIIQLHFPLSQWIIKCMYIPNQVHVYILCIKNTLNKKIKMHMIKTLFISSMKSKCAIRFIKCIRVYYPKLVPKTEKTYILFESWFVDFSQLLFKTRYSAIEQINNTILAVFLMDLNKS